MAATSKTSARNAQAARGKATLSASEALKAAEAAISVKPVAVAPKSPPVVAVKAAEVVSAPKSEPQSETVAPVTLSVNEGSTAMNDTLGTSKKFAEDTKAKLETVYVDFNDKVKAGVEKSTKVLGELSDITKGNVEALVESGKVAAKGLEVFGQDAVDYGRKSFEKTSTSVKGFSSAKTPTEFFQLQSHFLSSVFDDFTKEATKNSETFIKLAGDIAQPLTARVTVVTDKVKGIVA